MSCNNQARGQECLDCECELMPYVIFLCNSSYKLPNKNTFIGNQKRWIYFIKEMFLSCFRYMYLERFLPRFATQRDAKAASKNTNVIKINNLNNQNTGGTNREQQNVYKTS